MEFSRLDVVTIIIFFLRYEFNLLKKLKKLAEITS